MKIKRCSAYFWISTLVFRVYVLLSKHEAKMAGQWPSSFLCVYGPRRRPISSHLDGKSFVNKGFTIWLSGKYFSQDTAGSPQWARLFYLPRQGSQLQHAICFILQLTELDIYKIKNFTRIHLEPANLNSVISNSHYFWICPAGIFCQLFQIPRNLKQWSTTVHEVL